MPEHEVAVHLSIVVPVYNNAQDLRECVGALRAEAGPDTEIIVVDDASTDDTPAVAAALGVRTLRLPANAGPAGARNHGVRHAQGDVILFVDADVIVAPGTLARVRRVFADRPDVAAVFGSYDATPRAAGYVSRYRNLLHHFVHQNGHGEACTFWAGCGAIRREVFLAAGGFDERRFPRPSIEDIELGVRLRRSGHTILLDRTIQGTHLKRWGLVSMIRTDITQRALPWSRLILEADGLPDTLNLKQDQRLSAGLVLLAGLALALSVLDGRSALVAAGALATVLVLNRALYAFLFRRGGLAFATVSVGLHMLYYVYSALSYGVAWLERRSSGPLPPRARPSAPSRS